MAKKGGAPTKSEVVAQICQDADLSATHAPVLSNLLVDGLYNVRRRGKTNAFRAARLAQNERVDPDKFTG